MVTITLYAKQKKRHRCTEQTFGLCGRRQGWDERTASKHVYYLGWNRSPPQAGCMRQVLGPGALGRPRGIGWRGRWEEGSGWGIHVNPWLIHANVWQKPLQYCKVISLQLIKINGKSKIKSGEKWRVLGPHRSLAPQGIVVVEGHVNTMHMWGESFHPGAPNKGFWIFLDHGLREGRQERGTCVPSLVEKVLSLVWENIHWIWPGTRLLNIHSEL